MSVHRGSCGLSRRYEKHGYNQWRDIKRPSQILSQMCKKYEVKGPYYKPGKVLVGEKTFTPPKASDGRWKGVIPHEIDKVKTSRVFFAISHITQKYHNEQVLKAR